MGQRKVLRYSASTLGRDTSRTKRKREREKEAMPLREQDYL
jgi:hypothetical protein